MKFPRLALIVLIGHLLQFETYIYGYYVGSFKAPIKPLSHSDSELLYQTDW